MDWCRCGCGCSVSVLGIDITFLSCWSFLVTSGQEIVFQFCHSFPEILCPGADPSKSQALAIWDGICTVP